jgi:hypothetical protein
MDGSIVLGCGRRKRLLEIYRGKEADVPAEARLWAHIIPLLGEGHACSVIAATLFCSRGRSVRGRSPPLAESPGREAADRSGFRGR